MVELRRCLVRLGIIKAAHVVLPCQDLLRQILMSAGGTFSCLRLSESQTDFAAAAEVGMDAAAMATDAPTQVRC